MWKLMQLLGFYGEDDYDDVEEYPEEELRVSRKQKLQKQPRQRSMGPSGGEERYSPSTPKLVLFKGVPSEDIKLRLREALKDGAIILLDLHELSPRDFEEQGRPFITFMGGVAFARGGHMEFLEPALYLVMPREGMFQKWVEEDPLNDGAFDRQGR
ncbi:MAG: cell division protein SepF [Fretibacterium sp.]|nr:cell division protein SepF [Fretibacterium sp.]